MGIDGGGNTEGRMRNTTEMRLTAFIRTRTRYEETRTTTEHIDNDMHGFWRLFDGRCSAGLQHDYGGFGRTLLTIWGVGGRYLLVWIIEWLF